MQTVDANYTALLAVEHEVESKVEVYSSDGLTSVATFDKTKITELKTTNSLFADNTVGVGGATSGEIDFSVRDVSVTIPRMAMLKPYVRLSSHDAYYTVVPDTTKTMLINRPVASYKVTMYEYAYYKNGTNITLENPVVYQIEATPGTSKTIQLDGSLAYVGSSGLNFPIGTMTLSVNSSYTPTIVIPTGYNYKKSSEQSYRRSNWLQKGVYWIDTRSQDYSTGIWTFHGYDAMLKAEQINNNSSTTSSTLLTHICSTMGVTLDSRNPSLTSFTITNSITFTFREILRMIAAYNGGNWTFSYDGKLLFLPLKGLPAETYLLVTNEGSRITFGGVGILTEAS